MLYFFYISYTPWFQLSIFIRALIHICKILTLNSLFCADVPLSNYSLTHSPSPASGLLLALTGIGGNISSVDLLSVSLRTFSISGGSTSRVTVWLFAVWQLLFHPKFPTSACRCCSRDRMAETLQAGFYVPISNYSFTLGDTCISVLSESQSTEWSTKLYRVLVHCLRVIYSVQKS